MSKDLAHAIVGESLRAWEKDVRLVPFRVQLTTNPSVANQQIYSIDVSYPDPVHTVVQLNEGMKLKAKQRDPEGLKKVMELVMLRAGSLAFNNTAGLSCTLVSPETRVPHAAVLHAAVFHAACRYSSLGSALEQAPEQLSLLPNLSRLETLTQWCTPLQHNKDYDYDYAPLPSTSRRRALS